jgi:hypothetical protein
MANRNRNRNRSTTRNKKADSSPPQANKPQSNTTRKTPPLPSSRTRASSPSRPASAGVASALPVPRGLALAATALIIAAATGISLAVTLGGSGPAHPPSSSSVDIASRVFAGPAGPEDIALEEGTPLASATSAATGDTVGGVQCDASEQVVYHIHTHLTVFVDGALRPLPAGVGIVAPVAQQTAQGPFYGATHCYYWLHVHAQDGVIHIESPTVRTYTLGQFFAIWRQPLSATRIGPVTGRLTVFVDGRAHWGDPATIVLRPHEDIQVDVGTPAVAPERIDWSGSAL